MYISLMVPSIADLLPPLLLKKFSRVTRLPAGKKNVIDGYQNERLIELIVFKNLQLRSHLNQLNLDAQSFKTMASIGLGIKNKSHFSVLDFGGGAGHHQFTAKSIFKNIQFDWTVVETESLARIAATLITDEGLSFASDLNTLDSTKFYDLIFSNSALQYTEDPLNTLKDLLKLDFEHLFITRIPLTTRKPFSYMQESLLTDNGPGIAPEGFKQSRVLYKNSIASKESVERLLHEYIRDWISVDEGIWDSGRFGDSVRIYSYVGTSMR